VFEQERVAPLFPPWPEGRCLAPSADGRGPSRDSTRPTPDEKEAVKLQSGTKAGESEYDTRVDRFLRNHRAKSVAEVKKKFRGKPR
jgi:hypothetical protein